LKRPNSKLAVFSIFILFIGWLFEIIADYSEIILAEYIAILFSMSAVVLGVFALLEIYKNDLKGKLYAWCAIILGLTYLIRYVLAIIGLWYIIKITSGS
jgi:hypothetical protein